MSAPYYIYTTFKAPNGNEENYRADFASRSKAIQRFETWQKMTRPGLFSIELRQSSGDEIAVIRRHEFCKTEATADFQI